MRVLRTRSAAHAASAPSLAGLALAGLSLAGVCSSSGVARAQTVRTAIGMLTCTVAGAAADAKPAPPTDRPVSDADLQREMSCLFKPSGDGAEIACSGSVLKADPGALPAGKVVLIWSVVGPKDASARHEHLAQRFIGQRSGPGPTSPPGGPPPGPQGEAQTGLLIGEMDQSYALNAVTNATGAQLPTVTVVELKLKTVPA